MKIVLPGGSGHLGRILTAAFAARGDEVVVLSRTAQRSEARVRSVVWDGSSSGPWEAEIDGADAVVNLAGRSVDCRYSKRHLAEMMHSRTRSTRAVARAIAAAKRPPRTWLQMSTATVYAHRFDGPNDEETGVIGGDEAGVPAYWAMSVEIALAWEAALREAETPATRKVALRSAMVMSPRPGGPFRVLRRLARCGLGGPVAGGRQYVSWIHEADFVRAIFFLLDREDLAGPVNVAAPEPRPQRDFMRALRNAVGTPVGLPATRGMARAGAFLLRTDPELVLKSRRVVPGRLRGAGFRFEFPDWPAAAGDLARRR